jgi:hypothetical protein
MTCQICGRGILANAGTIAHHGYQRPGLGWQTGSCWGAKYPPLQASRDRLGEIITDLVMMIGSLGRMRAAVELEAQPAVFEYYVRDQDHRSKTARLFVRRETFDDVRASRKTEFLQHGIYDFDRLKARDLERRKREIEALERELDVLRKRFDEWKQTHWWDLNWKRWVNEVDHGFSAKQEKENAV